MLQKGLAPGSGRDRDTGCCRGMSWAEGLLQGMGWAG